MVAWSFYPRVGGSVTTIRQLSESLLEKGIEVHIIAPLLKKDLYKKEDLEIDKRIEIHWVVSSFAKSYTDFYSRSIFFFKFITKINNLSKYIDIFQTHDFNIGFLSAIMGTKKPIVAIFGADPLFELFYFKRKRCLDYEVFLKNKLILFLQKLMNLFISIASKNKPVVISLSENLNHIIKKYYSGPIVNIPVGINLSLYQKDGVQSYKDKDTILVVTRFVPWKKIDLAIEVFKEIKKIKRTAKIICIGGGPLKEYYLNKYKGLEGVTFITDLDYKKTIEYYKSASVLLVTSGYETFGINIIEAMAAGLPIVTSDLDVFSDRLSNGFNCYLVSDIKKEYFSDRIMDLWDNDKIREIMVKRSLEKVKEYTLDRIRDKYIELYNSLL